MSTFAEQLIRARNAKGMTQEELGKAIHASRSTIAHWEHGRAVPGLETVRRLAQVLCVDFFSYENAHIIADGKTPEDTPFTSEYSTPPPHFYSVINSLRAFLQFCQILTAHLCF